MTHRYIKIGVTGAVLLLAFTGLMWSTLRDGAEYFKTVDEAMTDRATWEGKPMQLKGYVVPGSVMRKPDTLEYYFKVQNNPTRADKSGHIIEAYYTGVVPDTFKDEAEVVLKGKLAADGFHTVPNGVIAKCPSKYEAASSTPLAVPYGTSGS